MNQQRQALAQAMDQQRPFSWLIPPPGLGRQFSDVQCGVYLVYSQQFFQQYRMARAA